MKTVCRRLFIWMALCAAFQSLLATAAGYKLAIAPSGNKVIVSWPVAATNYVLQSIVGAASTNWLTVTNPAPVPLNNTNYLTYTNNSSTRFFRLYLNTNTASGFAGMVLIPAGSFTMGNSIGDSDITDASPTNVMVSQFYLDTNLVTYSLWQSVSSYAVSAGYGLDGGAGVSANQPVYDVNWYDVVKWCNARSQQAGLTPVYFTDAALTQLYTNGQIDAIYANWSATGYRLPTEAEWEKAARGGLSGQRFPWGNTISGSQANYYGMTGNPSYDLGPTGNNAVIEHNDNNTQPFTSPVAYFAPNGYGLYDMAGNVCEWCWDWYATPYAGGTDPHGPAASTSSPAARTLRGGYWGQTANFLRCADRNQGLGGGAPGTANPFITTGFRCVRAH